MTLLAGTRIGPYEILAPIGAGGMGEVYRARDTRLDRDVAIKILPPLFSNDPERLARFEREAKTLASLNHPHIAQIHGLEPLESASGRALVMELVDGEDLSTRIGRGPILVDEALAIARQMADALATAHERGIIHRDLKPANIKVRNDGIVKVLDFGLAKALDTATGSNLELMNSPTITSPATQMGMILGTAAYMAPEQAKGRAIDRRADVWAFGVVLFEMLTGKRVFEGGDVTEVLASVIKDTPAQDTLPAATPPAIRRLLRRCLEKNPARRLDSMAAARLEIDDAMGVGADSDMAAETITARRSAVRSLVPLALTAVLLLAAGGGAAWLLKPSPVTDAPVARFAIPLQEGQTLGSFSGPSIAISIDGRRIAYRTAQAIYIRDHEELEEYEAREVLRSPGAGIWFSPDGQSLLFGTPSGLSRVAATGGRPQELVTAPAVRGADWHEDGTIIYATASALSRIPETGGPPQVLIHAAKNTSVLAWPQRLPDDKLLYSRWQGSGTEPSTIVSALDGSGERVVLAGHSGRYVATGHLLYGTEGRLHAAPFDPASGTVEGPPILVPETAFVSSQTAWAQIAVARSGTAVYGSSRSTENQTQLAWADGSGRTTVAFDVPRVYSDPRLAPDGRKVALHLWDEENDVWVADLVRGTLTRMTFTPGEEETPVWSPDGRLLAYAAERSGAPRGLLSKAIDGGAAAPERTIWQTQGHFHVNDWSPDGRTILIEGRRSGTANDLLAIDVESGKERALVASTFRERQGRFSPDGRWIAYTSDESGRDEVYVQAYPSLDGRVTVSTSGGTEPIWARDGKRLFFRAEGQIFTAAVVSASAIEFAAPAPLFPDTFVRAQGDTHTHFDVDANGRLLVINPRAGAAARERGQIHVVINWAARLRRLSAGR